MKIISYNVRGLGRGVKWGAIRRMIKKETVDFICLQETKKDLVDSPMCQALWGNVDVRWEMLPAINSAGGILDANDFFASKLKRVPDFVMV